MLSSRDESQLSMRKKKRPSCWSLLPIMSTEPVHLCRARIAPLGFLRPEAPPGHTAGRITAPGSAGRNRSLSGIACNKV